MNLIRILGENLSRERDRWLLWAPVALGAGIVAYFLWPSEPPLWGLAATPFLVAAIYLAWTHYGVALAISRPDPDCARSLYPLYTPQPNFMIAGDGKEWAARLDNGRLAVSNLDHEKFAVNEWQQRLGNPDAVDVFELPPDEKQLRCDEMGCVYRKAGHILAMPEMESAALEDCAHANIVIAPFLIRDCAAKTVLDDPDFWNRGAHVIYFEGSNVRIEYARERRAKGRGQWGGSPRAMTRINTASPAQLISPVREHGPDRGRGFGNCGWRARARSGRRAAPAF